MHTYEVNVYRDGRWWMIEIPELDGLTQARRVGDIVKEATDYIVVTCDVAPSDVKVQVNKVIAGAVDVLECEQVLEQMTEQVHRMKIELAAKMEASAKELAELDVPLRDIGELLHVSHQRAHQLINQ